jgi:ATP-dependent Clp protease adapter protein ClpS
MKLAIIILSIISCLTTSNAFSMLSSQTPATSMSTTVAPPKEKTKRKGKLGGGGFGNDEADRNMSPGEISKFNGAPLEYLEDEWSTRNPDDPFHILLLDTTFTKSEQMTVKYVAGCLTYVLAMPEDEATELTTMAAENGFSCLGTWERQECLKLGKQLQVRDLAVRVVPYCEGGMRGWQLRSADAGAGSNDVPYESGFE